MSSRAPYIRGALRGGRGYTGFVCGTRYPYRRGYGRRVQYRGGARHHASSQQPDHHGRGGAQHGRRRPYRFTPYPSQTGMIHVNRLHYTWRAYNFPIMLFNSSIASSVPTPSAGRRKGLGHINQICMLHSPNKGFDTSVYFCARQSIYMSVF